jgi:hypothetical protein
MYPLVARLLGSTAASRQLAAGGGGPTARYWRILVLTNQGAGTPIAVSAENIEMRATAGGSDITGSETNAISSSELSGSFIDDNAFDGNSASFWVSSNSTGYGSHWIGYDFGSDVTVNEIVLSKRPDGFGVGEGFISCNVQYSSDLSTWTTAWSFYAIPNWAAGVDTRTFTNVENGKPFWRVRATSVQGGTSFPWSASEVEFRATAGGADQASGGQILASSTFSSFAAASAFDNNSGTFWISGTTLGTAEPWIRYHFPNNVVVDEVAIMVRSDGFGANEAITGGVVESSPDGTTWTSEWTFTSPATWVNNSTEVRTFTRP